MTPRRIAAFVLLATVLSAPAWSDGIEIPCDGSPASAAFEVPRPGGRFLHVICTKFGHVLAPVAGWFWTQPGTYSPVFYPAQMVQKNPTETGNAAYFSSISVNVLDGKAAQDSWSVLAKLFPHEVLPTRALRFVAKSNGGSEHTIYIFPNAWGYSCSPKCSADAAFIMISENKVPPQW